MAHQHRHGCSCGCQHPQSSTTVSIGGKDVVIKGLIELLMPYAEEGTRPDDIEVATIIEEVREINGEADISDEDLAAAIIAEYSSMLPGE